MAEVTTTTTGERPNKKQRDLIMEYVLKSRSNASMPSKFWHPETRQVEIRARLRNIAARIKELETAIDAAKNRKTKFEKEQEQLKAEKGPVEASVYNKDIKREESDIATWLREKIELESLLEDYARKEKPKHTAVLEYTAEKILSAMGIMRHSGALIKADAVPMPRRLKKAFSATTNFDYDLVQESKFNFFRDKVVFALENSVPITRAMLTWPGKKMLKFKDERIAHGEPIVDYNEDEQRIISIWHPNLEMMFMDRNGKDVLFVSNRFGAMHYEHKAPPSPGAADAKAFTDFTKFKMKESIPRGWPLGLEAKLEKTEEGLSEDFEKAMAKIRNQEDPITALRARLQS